MADGTLTELGKNFVDLWKNGGHFGCGALFGSVLTLYAVKTISKERIDRHKIDTEAYQNLVKQLEQKDKRIDELHQRLSPATGVSAAKGKK
jgi:hypothetical protein